MRGAVVAAVAVVAVLVGAGAGYFAGSASSGKATSTVTATSTLIDTSTLTVTKPILYTTTSTLYPVPGDLGPWHTGNYAYPLFSPYLQCVSSGGYIYCITGNNGTSPVPGDQPNTTRTYYAHLDSNGTGPWTRTTSYPWDLAGTCVASSNFIYCIGGKNEIDSNLSSTTYYAPLSSTGIGAWGQTTPYPYSILGGPLSCSIESGYIYCLSAHRNATGWTSDMYFAQATSSGIGAWESATPPPAAGVCLADGGFIYCFADGTCGAAPVSLLPISCQSPTYYAPITSAGVGNWTMTAKMPSPGSGQHVEADGYIYDFAGPDYAELFTRISSDGMSPWNSTTPYPGQSPVSCVSNGTTVYCIGGYVFGSSYPDGYAYIENVFYTEVIT